MELSCFSFQFHILVIKIILFKLLVVLSTLKINRGFFFLLAKKHFVSCPCVTDM